MPTKLCLPTEEEIRAKAYEIYLARGCEPGHDADDWLQAEYELMHLPLRKVAELDATAIEKQPAQNHKLFSLTHAAMTLKKKSSKQLHPLWNRPATSRTAVAA